MSLPTASALYPLTSSQREIWFDQLLHADLPLYNIGGYVKLAGVVDPQLLQQALELLVQKHDALRSVLTDTVDEDGVPMQQFLPQVSVTVNYQDFSQAAEPEAAALAWMQARFIEPFFLQGEPLFRYGLVKITATQYYFFLQYHHLIVDGWAIALLNRYLASIYTTLLYNKSPQLTDYSYIKFIEQDRLYIKSETFIKNRNYWQTQYQNPPEPLLSVKHLAHINKSHCESLYLPHTLYQQLGFLAKKHQVTLFHVLLGVLAVYFSRTEQKESVIIGLPVQNRSNAQFKQTVGLFVGVSPALFRVESAVTFVELVQRVNKVLKANYRHQRCPISEISRAAELDVGQRLYDLSVSYEKHDHDLRFGTVHGESIPLLNNASQTPLTLFIREFHRDQDVKCDFVFNQAYFTIEEIKAFQARFLFLLEQVLVKAEMPIAELSLLTTAEIEQLQHWNNTTTDYPKDKTIVDLFEQQVKATPNNTAVVFQEQSLTYNELNQKANQVAHLLKNQYQVQPDTLIGICVERSLEMVIGLLGILKAGGAYVPLDPSYPQERLAWMLEDSQVQVLLTQTQLKDNLPAHQASVLCLDNWEVFEQQLTENLELVLNPECLAYVLFTSGSTGRPKGVMIAHQALNLYANAMLKQLVINEADQCLLFASINFDASIEQFLAPWLNGASCVLLPINLMPAHELIQIMAEQKVSVSEIPPVYWQQMLLANAVTETLPDFRLLLLGGEAVSLKLAQQTQYAFPELEFINAYGPTEAIVTATYYNLTKTLNQNLSFISIGQPRANTRIYILDKQNYSVPIGIAGELCIAGDGLARGYLNRPDLTAEKFIEIEIFGKTERVYKTGDLARWLPDGNLDYLGRIDHQIKLRGFRIELGEIEAILSQQETVKDAVVVLHEKEGNKALAAYVVLTDENAEISHLREALKAQLPDYMVPSYFTILDKLPLTPNGKIDRKALPEPEQVISTAYFIAPRNETEQQLATIWQTLLKRETISIHDNFFELGGDSILSLQIVARARQAGLGLTPRDVFQHQTIADLAAHVQPLAVITAEQGQLQGEVSLHPIQTAFLNANHAEAWHYNQAILLTIPNCLNNDVLRETLSHLLSHHDALRLRYQFTGEYWQQYYQAEIDAEIPYYQETLANLEELNERASYWQASFNLQAGPITRLVRFDCGNESRLLWCIHHLAVDGVSWRILLEDLAAAYQQALNAQAIELPAKTSSVRAWNQHLQDWNDADRAYWQQLPSSQVAYPIDYPTPHLAQHHTLSLNSDLTQRLLDQAPAAYRTRINDLLLTALVQTLHSWTGQREHLIDLESHGRNHDLFPDLDLTRTVGWFTALYSVPFSLPTNNHLGQQLQAIKEQLRQVPHDGIGYGVLRYLQQQELVQGQVLFNYLGQFDQSTTNDGLFQFAQESAGQSISDTIQSEYVLDINGSIIKGQLNLTFSSGYLNTNSLAQLSNNYQQHLTTLIEHCKNNSGYTSSDFPLTHLSQIQLDQLAQQHGRNIAAIYPLTPMQAGMLFHSLYAPDSETYISQLQIEISGQLNTEYLKQAWEILIHRHAVLRTAILTEPTPPLQCVLQYTSLPWLEITKEQDLSASRQQAKRRCTDFSQAPLMHLTLQRHSETDYTLYWDSHHLLTDGWCLPIVFEELFLSYQALQQGTQPQLPPVRPYQDYIRWLTQQDPQAAQNYWQHKLQGFTAPTPLRIRTQVIDKKDVQGIESYSCSPELTQRLEQQARHHRVTLNILVQAAWSLLLSRYSGQQDIVFGATSAGRHAPVLGIERMIGLFINTLPVRAQLTDQNLPQLLQRLQQQQQHDQNYAYTPLADIQRWSEVPNGIALFDSILVFENYPVDEQVLSKAAQALQIKNVNAIEQTNYPLTLAVHAQQQLHFKLSYQSQTFEAVQIEQLLQHLVNLLEGISQADAQTALQQLPLLTSTEIEQLQHWNNTATDYPKDKTIVDLFEQQVKATPNNTAVVFQEHSLTYNELNQKANQVAHLLKNQYQIQPDTLIGICVERSLEMVIGLLGILKAGGAYVPLDPSYPQERLAWMLEDSQVQVLLTQTQLKDNLPAHQASVLCLDNWELFEWQLTEDLELVLSPDSLAYVIYTSGSTGKPKGCLISHHNVIRLFKTTNHLYQFNDKDVWTLFHSYAFDFSVWELWGALLYGGQLLVVPYLLSRSSSDFHSFLAQHKVTILNQTPSAFRQLIDADQQTETHLNSLRHVIFGGEALEPAMLQPWFAKYAAHAPTLSNMYGITETTVHVTHCYLSLDFTHGKSVVGQPLADLSVYILDANQQLMPIGVAGEMYVAGDGVAIGYLNRPDLTAEKFIEIEIFGKTERVYKTGDLARWLPDGNLDYLGRIDHQVKLRGFRIELGEIEAVLSQQETVKNAVVILHEKEGNKALAAYVVLTDENAGISHLREALKAQLPDYMVPSYFTVLDKLPLTPNGKIDRKALPEPDLTITHTENLALRDETDQLLAALWSEILHCEITSRAVNFFELGGHSLLATQLISRIRTGFEIEIPLRILFDKPVLSDLADWLTQQQRGTTLPAITPQVDNAPLVMSYAQQRLWFLAQLEGESATYNMPAALQLTGVLDIEKLQQSLIALVTRQQSLRLSFPSVNGQATVVELAVYNPLTITDLSDLAETAQQAQIQNLAQQHANKPFNLEQGNLLQVELLKLNPESHILLFNMHHIISDGWSMGILIKEWAAFYTDPNVELVPLAINYTDYAAWQRNWLAGEILQQQLDYWKNQLAGAPELLELPTDFPRPAVQSYRGNHLQTQLAKNLSQQVQQFSQQNGCTPFMTLLAAFNVLLHRYSGQDDILIGSPIANRTQHQTESLIGFFVNTLVLRTQINAQASFQDLLKQTRHTTLAAYAHQDTPFEQVIEAVNPARTMSHAPLFQVMFVLQNTPNSMAFQLPELTIEALAQDNPTAKFDLTLSINEQSDGLHCSWEYDTDLFSQATIERLSNHFAHLLPQLLENSEQPIYQHNLLTTTEIEQLQHWNNTTTDYPKDKTIVDLFEQQVKATPNNTAVVFQAQSLTYNELNQKANQVAHLLKNQYQIQPDTLIGICVERSLEMVIGLLGILKAGGAYVPLDPSYPQERLAWMLEDSQIQVLLTQTQLKDNLPAHHASVLCLDNWQVFERQLNENLGLVLNPKSLAYVIYTSGSTGKPKGTLLKHKGLANYLIWAINYYQVKTLSNSIVHTSLSFDATITSLYCPLLVGNMICLLPEQDVLTHLAAYLPNAENSLIKITPAHLVALQENLNIQPKKQHVFVIGGEALFTEHLTIWRQKLPNARYINEYGPTETVVGCCIQEITQNIVSTKTIPIGIPIANTRLYILDTQQKLVPIGVQGELYIAGEGVGIGYLNRPDLTAEKFIEIEIFGKTERVYKTGDLARWLPDGNLDYLGRIDHQVKLRGFRIELGEIEAALTQQETVKDAAVILHEKEGNKALAAYVVLTDESAEISHLREALKAQLPDYMVPSYFTVLEQLPLTPNGKIDRKALPEPDLTITHTENLALRDETDQLLAALWSEVLHCEITSRAVNFFELGGHSLLATQLISRIRTGFEIEIPLRILFDKPVLSDLADWLTQQQRGTTLPAITPQADNAPLVMSYAQQRLWFLAQLEGESATYNMPAALQLMGALDIAKLQQSLIALVTRHQSLRLSFPSVNGQATVVELAIYNPLTITDLSDLSEIEQQTQIQNLAQQHANKAFNLEQGKLLQVELLKLNPESHVLLFNMHHIISDGWSMGILIKEWAAFYTDPDVELVPLTINYTDYAAWQRNWLAGEILQQQLDYWKNQLAGAPELLELPTDFPRPAVQSYRGNHLQTQLAKNLSQQVQKFSQQNGCTPFMTLLAAFNVLLHRYSDQDDILIGSPIANRTQHQAEGLIGFFVNTLVLRTQLNAQASFKALLKQTRHTTLAAYAHQDTPFEQVIETVNPARTMSHAPLFQVMFVLQNTPDSMAFQLPELTIEALAQDNPTAKFDLLLSMHEVADFFYCSWEYATDLFSQATIERLSNHFAHLLPQLLENSEQPIYQHNLLTTAEIEQLQHWNNTTTDYPKDKTIVDLFEQQVKATPNNTAVVFQAQSLTYNELNQKANQVAHLLKNQYQIQPDILIGICVERSLEMVIGLLGILKAGGAYVPLDPSYPQERLAWMLEDSQVQVLLTQTQLKDNLPAHQAKNLYLDKWATFAQQSTDNLHLPAQPNSLGYVIYTSGSTGRPKGVMLSRQALTNLIQWHQTHTLLNTAATTLQFTTLNFDVSFQEIFSTWLTGGKLVLIDNDTRRDAQALLAYLATHQIERLFSPVVVLQQLAEAFNAQSQPPILALQQIITAGEQLQITHDVRQLFQNLPNCGLHNHYGPSESHVVTALTLNAKVDTWPFLPSIGQPIANNQIYLIDAHQQLVPVGIAGELCIAGINLARGYLNRPDLTAEKFIEIEIFGKTERVYKTGDLARWLPDGNLEYLGRIDHQIKLRGFRIELGEIEAILSQQESVKDAAVILHEKEGNKALAAYVVLTDESAEISHLREALKAQLPDYMVPSYFTVLDKLPLTPNGKIDRKALPEPDLTITHTENLALRDETDQLLAALWSEVLHCEITSRAVNFFELGGHSLLATQLISRIRTGFEIEIPLRVLFDKPVLSDLADWLTQQQRGTTLPAITPQADNAPLVMSYAQQRLWFLAQLEGESATYNMPAALQLTGYLDIEKLQQSLIALVTRHQSLRLSFPSINGQATVAELAIYNPLTITDLSDLPEIEQQTKIQNLAQQHANKPFNLAQGKLLQVELLKLNPESHVLLFNMHHIISDGWSMGILIKEWTAFYTDPDVELVPLAINYTDYAAWQRNWLAGEILQQQLDYWKNQLAGAPELLELPTDFPRPAVQSYRGNHLQTQLAKNLSQQVQKFSQQNGCTPFMTLLAAFNVLLHRYSGQDDILIGSPIANRTQHQAEGLIGFFVNTLVLRTQLNAQASFQDLLKQTRHTTLAAYAHQDTPFEQVIEAVNPARTMSHAPLFQVMFVLQNTPDSMAFQLPELTIEALAQDNPTAKFDLTLSISEQNDGLHCSWEYATDLFSQATIERLSNHFAHLLPQLLENSEQPIYQHNLLTPIEIEQLQHWNNTTTDYPKDKTIVDLFEQQVKATPNNTAVVFQEHSLTYNELNQKANQVAHLLKNQYHIQPDTLIGICVERSLEMMIGLLGILKAGGAYVPLDPSYPQERLAWILEDSQIQVLLTQTQLKDNLPAHQASVLCLDNWEVFEQQLIENLELILNPECLAYVLFTSGSTGRPKGVMIEHHSVYTFVSWSKTIFKQEQLKHVLFSTSINFDLSIFEMFAPLSTGGQIYLVENALQLTSLKSRNNITLINTVPSAIKVLADQQALPASLKTINLAGEALKHDLVKQLYKQQHISYIYNLYGPSEDTTYSSYSLTGKDTTPHIGKPLPNTRIYLLDSFHCPVPQGIAGELCIAGDGLARGYLNRPDLTADKFIEIEIFGKTERVYKTGDLARWLPDGNLDYLGRIDHQVKLRGFRIELGEIEAVLTQQEIVKDAVVILHEKEGNKALAAYVVLIDENAEISHLREALKAQLPDYMVPSYFIVLDKLPLTPNGKIDRKALPEPEQNHLVTSDATPRNSVELQLMQIWQQVLNVQAIGIHDDFFALGGHSLLAVQLMSHIQQHWQQKLPLSVLFHSPTIAQLAQHLQQDSLPHTCLVPMQTQGKQSPLYCLPGAGGHVLYLHALARHLGTEQPMYGLETPGLHGEMAMPTSVEQHAAHLLQIICEQHPNGRPYRLAGHSAGGRVALALAHQLEAQGELVECLIILDTPAPEATLHTELSEVEALWSVVKIVEKLKNSRIDLTEAELVAEPNSTQRNIQVMQHLQAVGMFAPDTPITELQHLVAIYQTMLRNHASYQPDYQVHCPIILVKAQEIDAEDERPKTPDWGWQAYSSQPIQVLETAGEHITMLTEPHVAELAALLTQTMTMTTTTAVSRATVEEKVQLTIES